jgi:hypothetical protein
MGNGPESATATATPNSDDAALNQRLFALLDKLDLIGLPAAAEAAAGDGTAAGVIESTTLKITDEVKRLITVLGGATVVAGGLSSGWAAVKDDTALAVAIVAGIAVVLSALVLGLAKVVDGDVRGRAAVTGDQITGRVAVAARFLELRKSKEVDAISGSTPKVTRTLEDEFRVALAGFGNDLEVSTEDGSSAVIGVQWSGENGLRIRLRSGDVVNLDEVTSFKTRDPRAT